MQGNHFIVCIIDSKNKPANGNHPFHKNKQKTYDGMVGQVGDFCYRLGYVILDSYKPCAHCKIKILTFRFKKSMNVTRHVCAIGTGPSGNETIFHCVFLENFYIVSHMIT